MFAWGTLRPSRRRANRSAPGQRHLRQRRVLQRSRSETPSRPSHPGRRRTGGLSGDRRRGELRILAAPDGSPGARSLDPSSHQHGSLRCRWRRPARILRRCRWRVVRHRAADVSAERAAARAFRYRRHGKAPDRDGRSSARLRTSIRSAPAFSTRWHRRRTAPQTIARFKSFRLAAYSAATGVSALRTRMRTRCSSCLRSPR